MVKFEKRIISLTSNKEYRGYAVARLLIAHLARACQPSWFSGSVSSAVSRELFLITMPPATPTPRTYIHPSLKSNMCELNSEVKIFCTTHAARGAFKMIEQHRQHQ